MSAVPLFTFVGEVNAVQVAALESKKQGNMKVVSCKHLDRESYNPEDCIGNQDNTYSGKGLPYYEQESQPLFSSKFLLFSLIGIIMMKRILM